MIFKVFCLSVVLVCAGAVSVAPKKRDESPVGAGAGCAAGAGGRRGLSSGDFLAETAEAVRQAQAAVEQSQKVVADAKAVASVANALPSEGVNKRGERGETPAHVAARWGKVEALQVLHAGGADFNVKNNAGETVYDLMTPEVRAQFPEVA